MKLFVYTVLIVLPLVGMEKEPVKATPEELYRAIQNDKCDQIVELLARDKSLANISFYSICESVKEHTGEQETPLLYAIKENRVNVFRILMQAEADIDKSAQNGLTPLLCALLNQRKELAKKLVTEGANTHSKIHMYQGTYMDALLLALKMGYKDIHDQILIKRRELNHTPTTQRELTPVS